MTLFFYSLLFFLLLRFSTAFPSPATNYFNSYLPSDAVALLSFKSTADLDDKLLYSLTEPYDYCQWRGVDCSQNGVVRIVLDGVGLRGNISPESLSRLDQLRVLSLENNSLFGSIPDLSPLVNLKSLILSRNGFSGTLPPSIHYLRRLIVLDLSYNNFSGQIPSQINALSRLSSLNLEFNRFSGNIPALNQSSLTSFNVSGNNLTGTVPFTATLLRFNASSFSSNPGLCGEIINRSCGSLSSSPFFDSPINATSSSSSSSSSPEAAITIPPADSQPRKGRNGWLVLGFTIGLASLTVLGLCIVVFGLATKKRRDDVMMFQSNPKGDPTESPIQISNLRTAKMMKSKFKSKPRR